MHLIPTIVLVVAIVSAQDPCNLQAFELSMQEGKVGKAERTLERAEKTFIKDPAIPDLCFSSFLKAHVQLNNPDRPWFALLEKALDGRDSPLGSGEGITVLQNTETTTTDNRSLRPHPLLDLAYRLRLPGAIAIDIYHHDGFLERLVVLEGADRPRWLLVAIHQCSQQGLPPKAASPMTIRVGH